MAGQQLLAIDAFDWVSRTELTKEDVKLGQRSLRASNFRSIFPAGSSSRPLLMVGRERHIGKLNQLGAELTGSGDEFRSHIVSLLYGPRGCGKTALLDAFSEGMTRKGVRVISGTGGSLRTVEGLHGLLRNQMEPNPERITRTRGGLGVGRTGIDREVSEKAPGGALEPGPVDVMLQAVSESLDNRPLLIALDEAHASAPNVLGDLLSSAQRLNGRRTPIAVALAGTPDLLDILEDPECQATWVLDRASEDRLVPVGNLTDAECERAVAVPLRTLGVGFRESDLAEAALSCRGSPYFTQLLGLCGLRNAQGIDRRRPSVDFGPQSAALSDFRAGVEARYGRAWSALDGQGLTGCARQLGILWRWSQAAPDRAIYSNLANRAVASGLAHPPEGQRAAHSPEGASRYFRHLGYIWDSSGSNQQWELGLPSFFDYVESIYQSRAKPDYHSTVSALDEDLTRIIPDDESLEDEADGPLP
ncbi:MAG: ATP-binding protein [Gammaproteobacteria bacterium]|nr:ATP-binding protein [Gammaproteobacteria bacterium]MDE0270047.1 ATP-binding protein [Gammaproteobacteria bacterium]